MDRFTFAVIVVAVLLFAGIVVGAYLAPAAPPLVSCTDCPTVIRPTYDQPDPIPPSRPAPSQT